MKKSLAGKRLTSFDTESDTFAQKGFTLVELSIVLVIIGLIIGGVLKGQELIANAQIKNVASQMQGYQAAFQAFRDKYNALPGDLVGADNLIPGCAAAPCFVTASATLGNGQIGGDAGDTYNANVSTGVENVAAWQQLAAARFVGGIELGATSTAVFGSRFPSARTGGGLHILSQPDTGRHVLRLTGTVAAPAPATGALRPDQALQLDNILDDGQPVSGSLFTNATLSTDSGVASCLTVATNIYTAANNASTCNLVYELN